MRLSFSSGDTELGKTFAFFPAGSFLYPVLSVKGTIPAFSGIVWLPDSFLPAGAGERVNEGSYGHCARLNINPQMAFVNAVNPTMYIDVLFFSPVSSPVRHTLGRDVRGNILMGMLRVFQVFAYPPFIQALKAPSTNKWEIAC